MKHLIRAVCLLVAPAILFVFSSCGETDIRIENWDWQLESVLDGEGRVVACSPSYTGMADTAVEVEVYASAREGVLTVSDHTGNKTYSGTYSLTDRAPDSILYAVDLDGQQGYAVCGAVTYHDKSQRMTLILKIGDYTCNFMQR